MGGTGDCNGTALGTTIKITMLFTFSTAVDQNALKAAVFEALGLDPTGAGTKITVEIILTAHHRVEALAGEKKAQVTVTVPADTMVPADQKDTMEAQMKSILTKMKDDKSNNIVSVEPAPPEESNDDDKSLSLPLLIAIIGGGVVCLGIAGFVVFRKKTASPDAYHQEMGDPVASY